MKKKIKNSLILIMVIITIVALGVFFIKNSNTTNNNSGGSDNDSVRKVTLGIKNANYYPQTITVKVNEPVRIYLDSSVTGCYRAFTIPALGVSKYLEYPADYVEFTPTKKGSFRFACSMGMGTGTLIVE
jgi:plastocyanin domain-containing protein